METNFQENSEHEYIIFAPPPLHHCQGFFKKCRALFDGMPEELAEQTSGRREA